MSVREFTETHSLEIATKLFETLEKAVQEVFSFSFRHISSNVTSVF